MRTLHTVANGAVKGFRICGIAPRKHIAVKLCMLSKRSNYPIHAFNAELISLMSGHSRRDGALIQANLHARRPRANQARNRATFDSNRVGAQAASRALQDL